MLHADLVSKLARRLYEARRMRVQLRHFSLDYPHMTIEDGYAIQREWVKLEQADGRTIKGHKWPVPASDKQEDHPIQWYRR